MTTYKKGDLVKIIKNQWYDSSSDDTLDVGDTFVIDRVETMLYRDNEQKVYPVGRGNEHWFAEELELAEKTMNNLQVGDTLIRELGVYPGAVIREYTVGAVVDKIVFLIDEDGDAEDFYTVPELEGKGFKLKTEDEVKEFTLEEIAGKFNINVEKLRIKD